jgi:hypothetical protein
VGLPAHPISEEIPSGDCKSLIGIEEDGRSCDSRRVLQNWSRGLRCAYQGSAQHFVGGNAGINDFDVFTFYRRNPEKPWCYRWNVPYDFGDYEFGQAVDWPHFVGRRVDWLGRDIEVWKSDDAANALRGYIRQGRTKTARLLAQKAVMLLGPDLGRVVWPVLSCCTKPALADTRPWITQNALPLPTN